MQQPTIPLTGASLPHQARLSLVAPRHAGGRSAAIRGGHFRMLLKVIPDISGAAVADEVAFPGSVETVRVRLRTSPVLHHG